MNNISRIVILLAVFVLTSVPGYAQSTADRSDDREALRALLGIATDQLNAMNFSALDQVFAEQVVVTTVDQSVARSSEELAAIFGRWMTPDKDGMKTVTFVPEVKDDSAVFLTDHIAYATGTSSDTYTLNDGRSVTVPSRWTATVIKDDSQWKIATLHIGVNFMNNPVLSAMFSIAKKNAIYYAIAAGVLGLIIGILVSGFRRSRMRNNAG